ncbi:MAG: hypothetical protein PHQ74_08130 [Crocinitomicaceae bacterium]|nr:hypothetical protein [Crocinitomicaceae bacterium]
MKSIPLIFILLFTACTSKKEPVASEEKIEVSYSGNIFYPLYLGKLVETPFSMGPIMDLEKCQELNLSKLTLYVKGGRLPNNISEKIVYVFNKESLPKSFYHYLHRAKEYPYSELDFVYNSNKIISKINVARFMGISNVPPVLFTSDSTQTLALTSKGNNRNDSLIFYPSISNPKLILSMVNNFVNTLEIVAEKGSQTEDWKLMAAEIDSTLQDFALTVKTVTLTENGFPIASYDLDSNWTQKERVRSWEYNKQNQPVYYKEWLHGSLVKLMEITYASNNLPKMFVIDRKKFIFHSEFHVR